MCQNPSNAFRAVPNKSIYWCKAQCKCNHLMFTVHHGVVFLPEVKLNYASNFKIQKPQTHHSEII